jgi:sugar/nucleoside kinase (ribokinase family)
VSNRSSGPTRNRRDHRGGRNFQTQNLRVHLIHPAMTGTPESAVRGSNSVPDPVRDPPRPRRLGVLGTLVWDRIVDQDGNRKPVEEWGGIAYALEALSVALPTGWVSRPFLRLGEDLAGSALDYLRSIPRVETEPGVRVTPFTNHRVELRYLDDTRRTERLSGGIPPWDWEGLDALVGEVDALYLNFITGLEMGVDTALRLREELSVPLYADLHSLFQGISAGGSRFPRALPEGEDWFRAFHVVQMNKEEFQLTAGLSGNPWKLAAERVGPELKLIAVTLGAEGAGFVTAPDFKEDPRSWLTSDCVSGPGEIPTTGRCPLSGPPLVGDPTGCGDVWGATFFARLLGGDSLEEAMTGANRMAAWTVEYRGARDLRIHLGGLSGR